MSSELNRRKFLSVLGVGAAAALLSSYGRAETTGSGKKPNIIVILSDDVGMDQIGCYGGRYRTPNIDALAKGGMRFEYSYATPLCGPSRSQLLTGRYPFRTGVNNNGARGGIKPDKEIMVSKVLKRAGYATVCAGKWGQQSRIGPGQWGFDEYLKVTDRARYWATEKGDTYELNGKEVHIAKDEYVPATVQKFLVDFIAHHQDQPFFAYYPMSFMHSQLFRTADSQPGDLRPAEIFADNIAYMDKLVGQLVAELDRLKLREKTLIIFTGDNGSGNSRAQIGDRTIHGHKATLTEGGSRVPLIANWPGTTPAGTVNHDLTDFSDFFPTLAECGGAKLPTGVTIDGQSFAAQIKGGKGRPREWVYVELNGGSYVRDARYKLTGTGKLFDMKNAPFEELPVENPDAEAGAARQRLQKILNEHPAIPGNGFGKDAD